MSTLTHHLKCHPSPFDALASGLKTYELRRDDRGYAVGDELVLRRWCPTDLDYTGEELRVRVTHLTRGPEWGLSEGWVCMAVRRVEHDMTELETTLYEAVRYLLDRSQTDPDLGFLVGPATESFARLCRAEAAVLGEDVATVEKRRAVDLQPPYRRRRAEVLELREKVAECEGDHYYIERDRDEAKDECRELRAENSKLKEQLKDRPPYCPHCNRCPVCGWNRHPCVCP